MSDLHIDAVSVEEEYARLVGTYLMYVEQEGQEGQEGQHMGASDASADANGGDDHNHDDLQQQQQH